MRFEFLLRLTKAVAAVAILTCVLELTDGRTMAAEPSEVVLKVVMVQDENGDPAATGKAAAEALEKAMAGVPLKAVLVSECFEDRPNKEKLLAGLSSVLPAELILGGATYGSFTQQGCTDFDAVCLLGIGGQAVEVPTGLVTAMGTSKLTFEKDQELIRQRLHAAGGKLASSLPRTPRDQLLVVVADAHSPKVQYLVEGVQQVLGKQFPITGGCANKNAGQTFVYYQGKLHEDSAVALMLSGDFRVSLSGRQAMDNEKVISTAGEGAAEAMKKAHEPLAVVSFNCAGRRSKLNAYDDELAAIQKAIGREMTLFGCYCAGEIGPVESPEKDPAALCGGSGWHVMFSVIGR